MLQDWFYVWHSKEMKPWASPGCVKKFRLEGLPPIMIGQQEGQKGSDDRWGVHGG